MSAAGEAGNNASDNHILENIFARAGVHSVLEHDELMDRIQPKIQAAEREASRIATNAAEALRRSSEITQKAALGTVTWTGKSGLAGKVQERENARMRGRPRTEIFPKEKIERQLVVFFERRGGKVVSKDITDHFNPLLPDTESAIGDFKQLLKEVADFSRDDKIWSLKTRPGSSRMV